MAGDPVTAAVNALRHCSSREGIWAGAEGLWRLPLKTWLWGCRVAPGNVLLTLGTEERLAEAWQGGLGVRRVWDTVLEPITSHWMRSLKSVTVNSNCQLDLEASSKPLGVSE